VPGSRSFEIKELITGQELFFGNLPFFIGEMELKQLFEQKGGVESVTVGVWVEDGEL